MMLNRPILTGVFHSFANCPIVSVWVGEAEEWASPSLLGRSGILSGNAPESGGGLRATAGNFIDFFLNGTLIVFYFWEGGSVVESEE